MSAFPNKLEIEIKYHKAQIPFNHLFFYAARLPPSEDLVVVHFAPPVRVWPCRSINLGDLFCALRISSSSPAAVTRSGIVRRYGIHVHDIFASLDDALDQRRFPNT